MPSAAPIFLSFSGLPANYCYPALPNQLGIDIISRTTAIIPGNYSFFNYGSTTPASTDRDKPWFKTSLSGEPGKWYVYLSGQWVSEHPVPPEAPGSTGFRQLWTGSLANLITFDGGSAGAVGDTTGPMWEEDTAAAARFLIHPGTLPSTTVVPVTGTGGEETHQLTQAELPAFTLPATNIRRASAQNNIADAAGFLLGTDNNAGAADYTQNIATNAGPVSPATDAHNNMPPFFGVFLIKRTSRKFYVV